MATWLGSDPQIEASRSIYTFVFFYTIYLFGDGDEDVYVLMAKILSTAVVFGSRRPLTNE